MMTTHFTPMPQDGRVCDSNIVGARRGDNGLV